MALRLGDLLLKEKLVTPAQLEEALKNQVIYGIRLGSSLVEMGYVDEDTLAQLLSAKLSVPCVGRKELAVIPKELIRDFPLILVKAHHVVPLKLKGNRLSLAMTDPTDFKAIDDIGFVTGHVIVPHIAPDVQIAWAMATYYQLDIDQARYRMAAEQHRKSGASRRDKPSTIAMPAFNETGELLNVSIPAEFEGFAPRSGDKQDSLHRLPEDVKRYTVDRLSQDFATARNRDDVANIIINYLGQEFTCGALFIVRGNSAVGWRGVCKGGKISGFDGLNVSLCNPSVLQDVVENRKFSLGILGSTPGNWDILSRLNILPETSLLVLPVVMLNKVVVVVLVTAEMDELRHRLAELQNLVRKASLAFEMLIIKNKILMT